MRIRNTLLKWLTHTATVANVSDPSEHFRLLTLQSDSFKTRATALGDKIRVVIGGSLLRTYTPFDWNSTAGTAHLLAYRRGEGAASQWLGGLRSGDSCQVLGPQRSTPLDTLQRPAIFIGDETSFALAHSLQSTSGGTTDIKFLFEVSSAVETQQLLAAVGIRKDSLVERTEEESHLEFLNRQLMELMISSGPRQFVFSGKSSTIQHLSRSLKRIGRSPSDLMVKAFWAPGKQALD
jgi:ferric-chelate reductase (NADPH)